MSADVDVDVNVACKSRVENYLLRMQLNQDRTLVHLKTKLASNSFLQTLLRIEVCLNVCGCIVFEGVGTKGLSVAGHAYGVAACACMYSMASRDRLFIVV